MYRHKSMAIREIIKEKQEWCKAFNDYPYEYWKRRWDYLCRRLNNYSDMRKMQQQHKWYSKKEKEADDSQNSR